MLSKTFNYRPLRGDVDRIDLLYFAVDSCDVGLGLAKQVYYLGRPAFTSRAGVCPTSCVITRPGGHVIFQFNRRFFDELGPEEIAFVTLHEALHVAFRHAERRGRRDARFWNIACDIVINELLLAQPQFARVESESFKRLIEGAATFARFREVLLHAGPTIKFSAEAIYDRMTRDAGLRRWIRKLMAGHRPFHVDFGMDDSNPLTGRQAWEREQLARRLDRILDGQQLGGWTRHESGELREVQSAIAPKVSWDALLRNRVSSLLQEHTDESWQPSRRMAALYPTVILPSERVCDHRGRVSVLMAIDTSGSISPKQLDRLVAVTRTLLRERVELSAISFDVSAYPFNLDDATRAPLGGGGTSFKCIEEYAAGLTRYPDLIAVLTDGVGEAPKPLHPNRWLWMLTPDSSDFYIYGIGTTTRLSS